MQWLQDPNQRNVDNLNNVKTCGRHFRKYLKVKTDELETNSKIKKISQTCLGIISVNVGATCQLLITYSAFIKYREAVHKLFIDFKKANDSVRKEVIYNILIEFDNPMKPVWLIKMCLNETYN